MDVRSTVQLSAPGRCGSRGPAPPRLAEAALTTACSATRPGYLHKEHGSRAGEPQPNVETAASRRQLLIQGVGGLIAAAAVLGQGAAYPRPATAAVNIAQVMKGKEGERDVLKTAR